MTSGNPLFINTFQVTMETAKTDKFYIFLCATLGGVASLLDIALANDVAKVTFDVVNNAMIAMLLLIVYRRDLFLLVSVKCCGTLDWTIVCTTGVYVCVYVTILCVRLCVCHYTVCLSVFMSQCCMYVCVYLYSQKFLRDEMLAKKLSCFFTEV